MIRLTNTLSGIKEKFVPLKDTEVRMYNCGPTVYNFAHIGNLRAYVTADLLRRTLEREKYSVTQVINITDVGHLTGDTDDGLDKIEEGARRENKSAAEIAEFYTNSFFKDLKNLNIKTNGTTFPKASEHIKEQIELIQILESKGYTYATSDGIYFDTSKFDSYGKLGNVNIQNLKEGARVLANPEKLNVTDFALWKFSSTEGPERQQEWQSPWGVGFPGWHIECSAMSMKYLGDTFDIHTGGIDHIPVHHNNEIAQSECATGKPYARYWLHNEFVTIEGGKMAKSEGNFITLQTVIEKGFSPLAYRYFLLGAHYRTQVNFTWEALQGAANALSNLKEKISLLNPTQRSINIQYTEKFNEAITDDLDTPKALSILWELLKDNSLDDAAKLGTALSFDEVLVLKLSESVSEQLPHDIQSLITEREEARAKKDWSNADAIRKEIETKGYELFDTTEGSKVVKKFS